MASKTVILLLALFAAVLVLQVAVAVDDSLMSSTASCKDGKEKCGGKCVNVQADPKHCGKCGKNCGFGLTCCSGSCVNVATHEHHCGKCGVKCTKGVKCAYGLCGYSTF